ncbi:MAG: hypothetical protein V7K90_26540 [Nostoc sp.]|uniref:hypothetical protein n=1 Tax=Nostoc sp. TaxID=1180 RepID=UPI002FF7A364
MCLRLWVGVRCLDGQLLERLRLRAWFLHSISNYPFLLNNTLRSELFFKAKTEFVGYPTNLVIIVTKALMFPASNSTLYYEQAVNQLTARQCRGDRILLKSAIAC